MNRQATLNCQATIEAQRWHRSTLGEVATIERTGVDAADISDGTTYVGLDNIEVGGSFVNVSTVASGQLSSSKFIFTKHHVLYGKLRPYLAKIARPDFSGVCSTDILPILPGPEIDRDYLTHFLRLPEMVQQATSRATGANLPRISPKELATFEIPVPPLPEQRRIATVLDQVEVLRTKRREALVQFDKLTQSIFFEMFGDTTTNPKTWPLIRIGAILQSASYGTSEKAGTDGEFPVLRMNNLTRSGEIDLSSLKYMDLPNSKHDRYLVQQGDVLFNRTNSPELVGKTAIYRAEDQFAYAGYLIRLRTNERADPEYLAAFLNTERSKTALRGMCKSIIGMANINAKEIQDMLIPLVPLNLQQQFASRIGAIERLKVSHRAHLTELDALFASLQYRAFRGEL